MQAVLVKTNFTKWPLVELLRGTSKKTPLLMASGLIFEDLAYEVEQTRPLKSRCRHPCGGDDRYSGRLPILEGISGYVRPGEMVALMGTSGAGKTTLLDILAARKNSGHVGGKILYNGKVKKSLTNREAGYVLQADVALPNLTVQETLMYAARLRLEDTTEAQMVAIVEKLMKELQIEHCAHTRVGSVLIRGISGGELRRVSIAQDLITDPNFLFLDEPTSGLDSSSSFEVASVLSKLAKARNQVIICSIHQPSPQVFALFDKVLLLTKSFTSSPPVGRMVYFGPTKKVEAYFDKYLGFPCPPMMNLADHIVEMTQLSQRAHYAKQKEALEPNKEEANDELTLALNDRTEFFPELYQDFAKKYLESREVVENSKAIADLISKENNRNLDSTINITVDDEDDLPKYPTTWWTQFKTLSERAILDTVRSPVFFVSRILPNHIVGILVATVYGRIGYSSVDIQNRVSALFFLLLCSFMMGTALAPLFIVNRPITIRERGSRLYGAGVLLFSTLSSIFPLEFLNSSIFLVYVYWILNLNATAAAFFKFYYIFIGMIIWMDLYALSMGAFSATGEMAAAMLPLPFMFFMIFGGFFIIIEGLPVWWKWAIWISPFYYALSAVLYNEFNGVDFGCNQTNVTCTTYQSGDQLLEFYGVDLNTSTWWVYATVVYYAAILSFVVLYVSLRYCNWERR